MGTAARVERAGPRAPSAVPDASRAPPRPGGRVELCAGDGASAPHFHGQLELLLVRHGALSLTLGRRPFRLAAGQAAWVIPGLSHELSEFSADASLWLIHVDPYVAKRALGGFSATDGPFDGWLPHVAYGLAGHVVAAPNPAEFEGLHELALQITTLIEPELSAGLEVLLRRAFRASISNLVQSKGLGLAFSVPALLGADPSQPRSELARRVGVSGAYLTRMLRRELGVSFETQRNTMRLLTFVAAVEGARHKNETCALLEAAMIAGFGSYSQLHRVFVGMVGSRPSDYVFGTACEHRASAGR